MVDLTNPNFLKNRYYFVNSSPNGDKSCLDLMFTSKSQQTSKDVVEAIESYDCGDLVILEYVAKRYLTKELCEKAVSVNSSNLFYVPRKYCDLSMLELAFTDKYKNGIWSLLKIDKFSNELAIKIVSNNFYFLEYLPVEQHSYDLYKAAVKNDFIGMALKFVNFEKLNKDESLELCKIAVTNNGVAIRYVPLEFIDYELVEMAVKSSINLRESLKLNEEDCADIIKKSLLTSYPFYFPIEVIPREYLCRDLVLESIRVAPSSIAVLGDYIDKSLCLEVLQTNTSLIEYIPEKLLDMDMVSFVLKENALLFKDLPKKFKTNHVFNLLSAEQQFELLNNIPDEIPKSWSSTKVIIDDSSALHNCNALEIKESTDLVKVSESYSISNGSEFDKAYTFGYISDIHLEYQLNLFGKDPVTCNRLVKKFTKSLVKEIPTKLDALFILGDISSSISLTNLFYRNLSESYKSLVVSVLGNHELWRTDLDSSFTVDEIVDNYKNKTVEPNFILENELLCLTSSNHLKVITEKQILEYSDCDLRKILLKSKYVILGGIGFAGFNPKYNADYGLYNKRINRKEEIDRSNRFNSVYKKILSCASDIKVIVATHMNHSDWNPDKCNENWIYLNGHTHQNTCEFANGNPLVLADNQLGYKPKDLKIKRFTIGSNLLELLESYKDGIHEISLSSYLSFNQRLNINIQGVYAGDIVMLKREGLYMFLLKSDNKTYLLKGGLRYSLENQDIQYYFDNMLKFEKSVKEFFSGYRSVLSEISKEVKSIGGNGRIHGAIVDIDFYNHVYLNPLDGTIAYYYADDIVNKTFFRSFITLLDESPSCGDKRRLKSNYRKLIGADSLDFINQGSASLEIAHSNLIKYESTEMYSGSRIILDYQYILDKRVIRVWNDSLLNYEQVNKSKILALNGSSN